MSEGFERGHLHRRGEDDAGGAAGEESYIREKLRDHRSVKEILKLEKKKDKKTNEYKHQTFTWVLMTGVKQQYIKVGDSHCLPAHDTLFNQDCMR